MIWWFASWVWAAPVPSTCEGEPAKAAVEHFESMLRGDGPQAEVQFAACLAELSLRHVAQRHYLEVARMGPSSSAFSDALPKAIEIGEELGDLVSVEPYMAELRHRDLPATDGRDALLYVHASALLERDKLVRASGSAEEISDDYPLRSELFLGLGRALQVKGAHYEALQSLRAVTAGDQAGQARLSEARLFAELGRSQDAVDALALIGPDDAAADDASVRRVWLWSQMGEQRFAEEAQKDAIWRVKHGAFIPHADLLVATQLVGACRVRPAEKQLARFERNWTSVRMALAGAANTGRPSGGRSWEVLRGPVPVDLGLPDSVMAQVGTSYRAQSLARSLQVIDGERAQLDAIDDPAFRAIVAPHLYVVLNDGERLLHQLLGETLQDDLRLSLARVEAAFGRAESLRIQLAECEKGES